MSEKILNILSHLSQSINRDKDLLYDAQEIWSELLGKGYTDDEIEGAMAHIEKNTLKGPGPFWSDGIPVCRVYTLHEETKISPRARGYLWKMKSQGVLDHALEDEIVTRLMEMEGSVGLSEARTVAAITIFSYEHRSVEGACVQTHPYRILQ